MIHSSSCQFSYLDHMACNTEVNIQIVTSNQIIRLHSRFIGIDPKNSIILELGQDKHWQKANSFIFLGQELIVRIVKSDEPSANVLAFKSKIQRLEKNYGSWLLIDYPTEVQKVALRHQSRISINIGSEIMSASKGTEDTEEVQPLALGLLSDISLRGGAFVTSGLNTIICDKSYLLKVITYDLKTISIPITIKNILPIEHDNEAFQYGFIFNFSQKNSETIVQKIIMSHLLNN
ncbi:flagellar brake protein [Shewanella sp. D64]|uniref:flagellar brake domain-containing protein n=1 Tax=unclassified Shewanella TaxID=196818 RepID=UPI0022BA6FB7|nr:MULTISPECIES: flagellar brake domain-containing protein [unclassified Shewanella]MEC4724135.1 flagellar brake protein [Shewanella sp. D64]MEC4736155.1 flagellar brake protein [Shewanella sp. E94]WBJ97905.1 flagellar brake protein [Shewanella sp. MTB7]